MIKKIDFIRDFGLYKNFQWASNSSLKEFRDKNIIYGWNYSGKTTLSRIFSSLRDKEVYSKQSLANFQIVTDTDSYRSTNLTDFPWSVCVFNSDYIQENLRWEFDDDIEAILFEVGDNASISRQVKDLQDQIDLINGTDSIRGKREPHIAAIEEYGKFEESLYTNEARRIKNDSFSSLIEFNKSHLKKIRDVVIADLNSNIITGKTELQKISKIIKVEEPKEEVKLISFQSNLEQIVKDLTAVLKSTPDKDIVTTLILGTESAHQWVKEGLSLHEGLKECVFCSNTLSNERVEALTVYFQNQASKLREQIQELSRKIDAEVEILKDLIVPTSSNDFNVGFQEVFEKKKARLEIELRKYSRLLIRIKKKLDEKLNKSLHSDLEHSFEHSAINGLNLAVSAVNDIILQNNQFINNFQSEIENKRTKYKNHLVSSFLKREDYRRKKKRYEKAVKEVEKLDDKVNNLELKIKRLEDSRTSETEGRVQLNCFIQSFLGTEDIQVQLNEDTGKYNLMRGETLASDLSEGEKMAISFSHFLVSMRSLEKSDSLKDTIVFIDDPISSLDSNHVFQINSLLQEQFFKQVPATNGQLTWSVKCRQFFCSTHNFEFFNLLKELPNNGFKNRESRYLVYRKDGEAEIDNLPKVYNNFASEYHFLFQEIVEFDNDPNRSISPRLYTIPNILRRFLEMYTLTQYPSADPIAARTTKVFGKTKSKRILKVLHHFSHFDNIDRINGFSSVLGDIENACSEVVNHLKVKDTDHYDALNSAIN